MDASRRSMGPGFTLLEGMVGLAGTYYETVRVLVWSVPDFITSDLLRLDRLLPIQFQNSVR